MLAFTGKYWTGCLYLNNCVHGSESFLYLKLYNTIILVNASMGNQYSTFRVNYCPCWHLLVDKGSHKSIIHAGIYWLTENATTCMVIFHIGIYGIIYSATVAL